MKRFLLFFFLLCAYNAFATNYYVDPVNGDDTANDGKSQFTPWETIKAINDHSGFSAGDSILLLRGKIYGVSSSNTSNLQLVKTYVQGVHPHHPLYAAIRPKGSGTASEPIILGAYGNGAKPIIHIEENHNDIALGGVVLLDQEYFIIQDLRIEYTSTSKTVDPNTGSVTYTDPVNYRWGIFIRCDRNVLMNREGIVIRNNEVYNVYGSYSKNSYGGIWHEPCMYEVGGIIIDIQEDVKSTVANNRMSNVLVEGNYIENTTGTGIYYRGQEYNFGDNAFNWNNLSDNVVIRNNHIKDACDGIIVAGTDNVLIERNIVDGAGVNGTHGLNLNIHTKAVMAIWPTFSRDGIIQYNEVMNTKSCPGDGQALHTDQGASGTAIFQYNYTHDNEGAGFCETWSDGNDDFANIPKTIFRYNISYNDGDINNPIHLNLGGTEFYNNTIYNDNSIVFDHAQPDNHPPYSSVNNIRNNIFITNKLYDNTNSQINNVFDNNYYVNSIVFNDTFYLSMIYWHRDDNAIDATSEGPKFVNGFKFNSVNDFKLQKDSPLIGAGIEISNNGGRDFWGTPLYSKGNVEVGAYEERIDITPAINLLLD